MKLFCLPLEPAFLTTEHITKRKVWALSGAPDNQVVWTRPLPFLISGSPQQELTGPHQTGPGGQTAMFSSPQLSPAPPHCCQQGVWKPGSVDPKDGGKVKDCHPLLREQIKFCQRWRSLTSEKGTHPKGSSFVLCW